MKGIAHFLTGVAIATCVPEVVALAREGSLLPVLGGIGGLLPDTLDFRFVRYFESYDTEIDPERAAAEGQDPATAVVDTFADAMRTAYETRRPISLIAHTLRLGVDLWRRYTIRLDPESGAVAACIGPLVNTGQVSYPGTEPSDAAWVERHLDMPLEHSYQREYHVDIFTGPSFRFVRQGDRLMIHFLDWHHRWTHSLLLAVAVGALVGIVTGRIWGSETGGWAALVSGLGFVAHVIEDQMGHMGSNMLWPLTRRRIDGLRLLHASDAMPNFLIVTSALALTLFNLDRFGGPGLLPARPYLMVTLGLPWMNVALRGLHRRWFTGRDDAVLRVGDAKAALSEAERKAEAAGMDLG